MLCTGGETRDNLGKIYQSFGISGERAFQEWALALLVINVQSVYLHYAHQLTTDQGASFIMGSIDYGFDEFASKLWWMLVWQIQI